MTRTFSDCYALKNVTIPNGITNLSGTFVNCTSLEELPAIPSSVTSAEGAFKNCTSLQKIDEFHIPLNTLKNNPDFQDMFAGCTSLTQIGFKIDTDTWHAWRLKFDANSVEGKIFGFNNGQLTSTAVLNTQISKNDIRLPVLTDELWFPPANMSDSDVEDVIRSVLNNRYTYWNKAVIDPNSKSLVMMASDPNNVVSNFLNGGGGGGVEKLVISTTRSVNVTKDTRIFADGSAITITLNYGSSAEGYVAEVYAIQACTITYYTAQGTTTSLAMEAGGKAIFVYFSGWKLHSNYGTTNSVTVNNMQSVSSSAVATTLQGYATTSQLSNYYPSRLAVKFNVVNNYGQIKYYKIGGMCVAGCEFVFLLQSRYGELYLLSVGHDDGSGVVPPLVKRLLNQFSNINAFSYKDGYVYIQIMQYSHECMLTQIAGNTNANITITETTQADFSSGTAITIQT